MALRLTPQQYIAGRENDKRGASLPSTWKGFDVKFSGSPKQRPTLSDPEHEEDSSEAMRRRHLRAHIYLHDASLLLQTLHGR